jgi:hypothetical protein
MGEKVEEQPMPKKLDFEKELHSLRESDDRELRPVTTRIPIACLRMLYRACSRGNIDLSSLVRLILEEQAEVYLKEGRTAPTYRGEGIEDVPQEQSTELWLRLSREIKAMAEKTSAGLGIDLATLLQLIVTEGLPAWILKSREARQQRQQALDRLENKLTPERVAWGTCARLAPPEYQSYFRDLNDGLEIGELSLELTEGFVLYLLSVKPFVHQPTDASEIEKTNRPAESSETVMDRGVFLALDPGADRIENAMDNSSKIRNAWNALDKLITRKILVPEPTLKGQGSRWQVALPSAPGG